MTVKFELANIPFTLPNVTVPTGFPEYLRIPFQPGDFGVVMPADAYLGGISGLGGGTADLSIRGNLSSLVFVPVGNKNWTAVDNSDQIVLYGPDGGVLRTKDNAAAVSISADGAAIKVPLGKSVQITTLPLAPAGLPAGSLWNDAGDVKVT